MFIAIAETPLAGTSPTPVTLTVAVAPAAIVTPLATRTLAGTYCPARGWSPVVTLAAPVTGGFAAERIGPRYADGPAVVRAGRGFSSARAALPGRSVVVNAARAMSRTNVF
jgi:hypothetical protein